MRIAGRCPACGHETLRPDPKGALFCVRPECPRRTAASELLGLDHRHAVDVRPGEWSMEHPVVCRLDRSILDCPVHALVTDVMATDAKYPGRYRVELLGPGILSWTEVSK